MRIKHPSARAGHDIPVSLHCSPPAAAHNNVPSARAYMLLTYDRTTLDLVREISYSRVLKRSNEGIAIRAR